MNWTFFIYWKLFNENENEKWIKHFAGTTTKSIVLIILSMWELRSQKVSKHAILLKIVTLLVRWRHNFFQILLPNETHRKFKTITNYFSERQGTCLTICFLMGLWLQPMILLDLSLIFAPLVLFYGIDTMKNSRFGKFVLGSNCSNFNQSWVRKFELEKYRTI